MSVSYEDFVGRPPSGKPRDPELEGLSPRDIRAVKMRRYVATGKSPVVAARLADQYLTANQMPTSQQMSDQSAIESVGQDMSRTERRAVRFLGAMDDTLGAAVDMLPGDAKSRVPRQRLDALAAEAKQRSTGITEGAFEFGGRVADPAFWAAYGAGRSMLAGKFANAAPWKAEIAKDLIAGVGADAITSGVRNDFDPAAMATDVGYGAAGAVGGGLAMRGLGQAWKRVFGERPLLASAVEAKEILDRERPNWDVEAFGARQDEAARQADLDAAEARAREIIPDEAIAESARRQALAEPEGVAAVGERIKVPERARTGIERFESRQAAREAKLQEGLDAPYIERDRDLRSAVQRLEAENAGGRVLTEEDIQKAVSEDIRAESLKDPEVLDEIEQLEAAGMTRQEAESLAIGVDIPAAISAKARGATTILPDIVNAGLRGGEWTIRHTVSAARWAIDTAGDSIRSMRDFAQALIGQFGRAIRKHVPAAWERFKKMQASRQQMRERTALLRQKGGIDTRSATPSPQEAASTQRTFQKDKLSFRASQRLSGVKKTIDNWIDPIADRMYKASPRLANRLYQFMTEANITKHELRSVMDPIMSDKAIRQLPIDTRNQIKSALLNADPRGLNAVASRLDPEARAKLGEMMTEARRILDDLHDEAKAVGMDPGYLVDFWPRSIKPGKTSLLREKLSGSQKSMFDDAIKDVALRKYGGNTSLVPEDEKASIMARVLAGYGPRPLDSSLPKPLKRRVVSEIPDDLLQYYQDFDKSLDAYIERMSNEIAKRRMLGGDKSPGMENEELLAQSIAKMIADEGITGNKADEVAGMIQSVIRGSEAPLGTGTRLLRDGTYILTMGQIGSAIRQLGDFTTSMNQYGVINTLKGAYRTVLGDNQVSLLDLGLDRMAEEYAGARSSKAVDFVFKATGLDLLDRKLIKNTAIEAALIKAQQKAASNPESLARELTPEFGDEAAMLVEDLANGEVSDRLMVYLTSRLGNIQPITRLEVPQAYLDGRASPQGGGLRGWPVLAYQLKTFTLRRMGLMRRQGLSEMARGVEMIRRGETQAGSARFLKGARNLVTMAAMFAGADAAVDQLINWVYSGDESWSESMWDSVYQLVGTNRYAVEQTQRSGASGFTAVLAPPSAPTTWQLLTDITRLADGKDAKTLKKIPHAKTVEIFLGLNDEDGGGSSRPGRPAREGRAGRPER